MARKLCATEIAVVDAHSDIMDDVYRRRRAGETGVLAKYHLPALTKGKVKGLVLQVGSDFDPTQGLGALATSLEYLDNLHLELEECPGHFAIASGGGDIERIIRSGRIAILPTIEGAMPVGVHISGLRTLYRLGVRQIQLTWNYRNLAADGVAESQTGGGLTHFGTDLVREAFRLGMAVDVSHLALAGLEELLKLDGGPVIASHVCARSLVDHPRNLWDQHIRAIAKRDGVIGVCFYTAYLGGFTMHDLLRHILHVVDVAGIDHVAIGPDYVDYLRPLARIEHMWDKGPAYPEEVKTAAKLPNLADALLSAGCDKTEVWRIMGGNLIRFYRRTLG